MNEQLKESLSALMDGEAGELELKRVLAESHRAEVRDAWQQLQHTRRLLQGDYDHHPFKQLDISQQVSAALAEERLSTSALWWRPMAGFAVAASVAVAIVVGVQLNGPTAVTATPPQLAEVGRVGADDAGAMVASSRVYPVQSDGVRAGGMQAAAASNVLSLGGAALSASSAARQVVIDPSVREVANDMTQADAAQRRFEAYILRHTEQAALVNQQGMVNFVKVNTVTE